MSDRQNGLIFTLGISFVGLLLLLFAPKDSGTAGEKKCPFCSEWIKSDASVCRFCQRDLPTSAGDAVGPARDTGYRITVADCPACSKGHELFVASSDYAYKNDVLRFTCPDTNAVLVWEVGNTPAEMEVHRQHGDLGATIASTILEAKATLAKRR